MIGMMAPSCAAHFSRWALVETAGKRVQVLAFLMVPLVVAPNDGGEREDLDSSP
jgi:hypothetical protein